MRKIFFTFFSLVFIACGEITTSEGGDTYIIVNNSNPIFIYPEIYLTNVSLDDIGVRVITVHVNATANTPDVFVNISVNNINTDIITIPVNTTVKSPDVTVSPYINVSVNNVNNDFITVVTNNTVNTPDVYVNVSVNNIDTDVITVLTNTTVHSPDVIVNPDINVSVNNIETNLITVHTNTTVNFEASSPRILINNTVNVFDRNIPIESVSNTSETLIPVVNRTKVRGRSVRTLSSDDFDISYGDNVLLGATAYEIRGEDIELDTLKFEVTLTAPNWTGNDEPEELIIENAVLEVAGETAFYANDDIEFTTSKKSFTGNDAIEFDGIHTVRANRNNDVLFAIYGNLDSDWGHSEIDGATIEFKLVGVEDAESVVSQMDVSDLFLTDNSDTNEEFESVTIEGNEYEFTLRSNDVEEDEVVAGTDNLIFGTLRVDAEDAVDDIVLTDASFTMTTNNNGDLDNINNCVITDPRDREIADARNPSGSSSDILDFDFDGLGYRVDAGEEEDLLIRCDIDKDALIGETYKLTVTNTDTVEYEINGDEFEHSFQNRDSETITVASTGSLEVTLISPEKGVDAIAVGNNGRQDVTILSFELEADKEDLEITDIVLGDLKKATGSGGSVADVIERVTVTIGGQSDSESIDEASDLGSGNYTYEDDAGATQTITSAYGSDGGIAIENVNIVIPAGRIVEGTVSVDYKGIDDDEGVDGEAVELKLMSFIFEGEESDKIAAVEKKNTSGHDAELRVFRNLLVVTTNDEEPSIRSGERKIYSVTLRAEGESGDRLYVDGFTFDTRRNAISGDDSVTIGEAKLKVRGSTKANFADVADNATDTKISFDLSSPERIPVGDSVTFDVFADLTVNGDGELSSVAITEDTTAAVGGERNTVAATSGLIWTPNSLDNGDATSSNANWFNAYALYDGDEIGEWVLD